MSSLDPDVVTGKQLLDAERTSRAIIEDLVDARLAAFVEAHYPRLLRLARLICRDGIDAADAVQIALEQAWRKRASLREDDRMQSWLDRIVAREATRLARGRRGWLARLLSQSNVGWIESPAGGGDLSDTLALKTAFAGLSPEQRAVVAVHLHLGYSVTDTAAIVGAPLETVRSRLRLARARLRAELAEVDR